jgi:hypothetical protein
MSLSMCFMKTWQGSGSALYAVGTIGQAVTGKG